MVVDCGGDDQLVRLGLGDDRLEAFRTVSADPTYERRRTLETWSCSAGDQCASTSSTGGGS